MWNRNWYWGKGHPTLRVLSSCERVCDATNRINRYVTGEGSCIMTTLAKMPSPWIVEWLSGGEGLSNDLVIIVQVEIPLPIATTNRIYSAMILHLKKSHGCMCLGKYDGIPPFPSSSTFDADFIDSIDFHPLLLWNVIKCGIYDTNYGDIVWGEEDERLLVCLCGWRVEKASDIFWDG